MSTTTHKYKDTTPKSALINRNCVTDVKKVSNSNLNKQQEQEQTILYPNKEVEKPAPAIAVPDTLIKDDTVTVKEASKITIVYDTLRIDDTVPLADTEPLNDVQENYKTPAVRNKIQFFKFGKLSKQSMPTKRDASTSTLVNSMCEISVQTISLDEMFEEMFDFKKVESSLINKIYIEFETNTIDSILNEYLNVIFSSKKKKKPPSPPPSPSTLNGVTVINDSLEEDDGESNENDQSHINHVNERKNLDQAKKLNNQNFADLLNASRFSKSSTSNVTPRNGHKKEQRKIPCLEFVSTSSKMTKECYDSPKRDVTTPLKESTNFVVTDTPCKEDEKEEVNKNDDMLSEGLTRSASRMEAVNARVLIFNKENNSIVNYQNTTNLDETMSTGQVQETNTRIEAVQKSQLADGTPILNSIEPTLILEDNGNLEVGSIVENKNKKFQLKKAPIIANHSLFLNSINEPSPSLATNATNVPHLLPPNANDILGVSYNVNENTLSTTIATTDTPVNKDVKQREQTSMPAVDIKNMTETPPPETNKEEDSQITDSELNRIDNLCQDIYEGHNKTMATETSNNILANLKGQSTSKNSNQKIEFVCSLLTKDLKVK